MSNIRAVLFDLDGTLRDTRKVIYNAHRGAVEALGGPRLTDEDLFDTIAHHSETHAKHASHVSFEEFDKAYREVLFGILHTAELYDQARDTVLALHSNNFKLGIVSSAATSEIEDFLKRMQVLEYFDAVVGDDGIMKRKPAPDPVLAAAELLNVKPAECVMVGDMRVDMQAGKAAGVAATIGITHGFHDETILKSAGATHIIHGLDAVPELLEHLAER